MERATRDRLTGAVILVAIAAILVPEMLSGPGDDAARSAAEPMADTGPPLTTYEMSLDPSAPSRSVRQAQSDARELAETVPPPEVTAAEAQAVAARSSDSAPQSAAAPVEPEPLVADRGTTPPPPEAAARATSPAPANASPAPAPSSSTARVTAPAPAAKPAPAAAAARSGSWWVQVGSFSSEANARGLASQVRAKGFGIEVAKVRSGDRNLFSVRAGPVKDRDAAQVLRSRLAAAGQQGILVPP